VLPAVNVSISYQRQAVHILHQPGRCLVESHSYPQLYNCETRENHTKHRVRRKICTRLHTFCFSLLPLYILLANLPACTDGFNDDAQKEGQIERKTKLFLSRARALSLHLYCHHYRSGRQRKLVSGPARIPREVVNILLITAGEESYPTAFSHLRLKLSLFVCVCVCLCVSLFVRVHLLGPLFALFSITVGREEAFLTWNTVFPSIH